MEDTGKPIWEARADILACADALEFFGGVAPIVKGWRILCVFQWWKLDDCYSLPKQAITAPFMYLWLVCGRCTWILRL